MPKTSTANQHATLEDAIALAAEKHKGFADKAGGAYILHPLRIMMKMETRDEMMAAVLHDVVEDTDMTIGRLKRRKYPEAVVRAVDHLSRRKGESYEDFVLRAGSDPIARKVKLADLEDNMNIMRLSSLTEKDMARLDRYHKAWTLLSGGHHGDPE